MMTTLLKAYIKEYGLSSKNSRFFDYYYYYYTLDPVKNFIRMCLTDQYPTGLPDSILWYLIRLFYSVKGTPKVLDLMETALGLQFVPDSAGRRYVYSDKRISYELKEIRTFNLGSFMEAQEKFLSALLYYYDLTALIDRAKLDITETLESEISVASWKYTKHEIRNIN